MNLKPLMIESEQGLLPCPCCGYRAQLEQIPHDPKEPNAGGYYIECKRAGCGITTRIAFHRKGDAIPSLTRVWNRRQRYETGREITLDKWADRFFAALHERIGVCGHCGKRSCSDRKRWSVLPPKITISSADMAAIIEALQS